MGYLLINFNNFTSFYEVPNFHKKDFSSRGFEKYNIYFCSQSLFQILPDFDLILKKDYIDRVESSNEGNFYLYTPHKIKLNV